METNKIDEITSIRYVGIEPSFKMIYYLVTGIGFWAGLHHLILKDIKGFIFHWVLANVSITFTLTFLFLFLPLAIPLGIVLLAYLIIPGFMMLYHYTDDDYFDAIKNKSSWPLINRMLMIVPKK
ncbi:hypothetical protein [Fibrobacter intestinalis]|uniref:Uncharacterized protein n=1 Tax=Fibrobacter intestinalis TaxID=28122 RepID=A0A1T4QSY1_9BACT|nr:MULTISPECIES: hypothetical protein [Fibrobacter]PBC74033.1 hypothetical protein BGW94_1666 [Fibrobacter sp. NR9]SKA06893.1 hypothetical protein SAMN02745108_02400 [Fibrobacter intestinalis]